MDAEKKSSEKRGRRRSVHFVLREEDCPGLIAFLDSLENRMESKTVRSILSKWFEDQSAGGTANLIEAAIRTIHDFELAGLRSKAQPHPIRDGIVAEAPERKQIHAQGSLVQSSPPPVQSAATALTTAFPGGMARDADQARHEKLEVKQPASEKSGVVEEEVVVGFLDDMFRIGNG